MSSILAVLSHSPFNDSSAKESLDFAMSATAYGHTVTAVLVDDGVYQLLEPLSGEQTYKSKHPSKVLKSLPFFDIEECYVCHQSATSRSIDCVALSSQYTLIDACKIKDLISSHDFVVNL